jgi:hypothetical protein
MSGISLSNVCWVRDSTRVKRGHFRGSRPAADHPPVRFSVFGDVDDRTHVNGAGTVGRSVAAFGHLEGKVLDYIGSEPIVSNSHQDVVSGTEPREYRR